MIRIECTRGMFALIDDVDFELVNRHRWAAVPNNKQGDIFYARARHAGRFLWMHNLILGCDAPHRADHRDGNGLNNQRQNLRPCNRSLNGANSPRRRNHSLTGFRGVYSSYKGRVAAQIRVNGRLIRLGYFRDPIEAAQAYDAAAQKHFGEFASLNFPLLGRRA